MTADLEGRSLDVKLAEALGWSVGCCGSQFHALEEFAMPPNAPKCKRIPRWHASLDAIMRDIWPVLAAKGWKLDIHLLASGNAVVTASHMVKAGFHPADRVIIEPPVPHANVTAAAARACLKALEEPS